MRRLLRPTAVTLGCALLLAVGGCGDGAPQPASWEPLRGDSFGVADGTAVLDRDAWVSRWYGRESPLASEATLLGDERAVLRVSTPSWIAVGLGPGPARRLKTAVRRGTGGAEEPLRAEVFWDTEELPQMVSLWHAELTGEEGWVEVDVAIPPEAGLLRLIVRYAHPAMAERSGPEACWAHPRVAALADAAESAALPDIILVTVDTLRSDTAQERMPWVQSVIARGRSWPRAVSPSNWTLPAYASLLTGRGAGEHGAGRDAFPPEPGGRDYTELDPALRTFVATLAEAGYATCMVHQNPFLEPWAGLSRDFERWVRVADAPTAGRAVADDWWQRNADRPRLLVLHFFAPHLPYAPEPLEGISELLAPELRIATMGTEDFLAGDHTPEQRAAFFDLPAPERVHTRERYELEARVLDHDLAEWLGPRLDAAWGADGGRGLLFAFHADHGEEFWDAGSFEHGHSFDDSVVRVPLALVWPGQVAAAVDERPVPAGLLGLELLRLLGLEDPALPALDLGPRLPEAARSSHPLYRAAEGGRVYHLDGRVEALPFDGRGSGGAAPVLPGEVQRQLAELGYAGD